MRWKHPLLTGFKKPTNCLTWWRRRATQLLLNRGRGQNPTGSHLDESLAKLGFRCTKPQIPRNKILMDGHYQLSDISFRRVRGLMVFLPFYLGLLGPLSGSFSESPTPASDSAPDLVRRIFLEEMEPRDRHLGLLRQPAGKVEIRAAGEEQTGISLHEQLGYLARLQPICVGRHDRSHVGRVALNGYLPGPRQRWPSPLPRCGERPPILRHLLVGKLAQDCPWQDLLDEEVVFEDHRIPGLGTERLQSWAHIQLVPVVPALRPHDRLHVRDAFHRLTVPVGPIESERRA